MTVLSRLFPGSSEQVREARRFARAVLGDDFEPGICDTAEQIVSTLATNAIVHTSSGQPDDGWFVVHVLIMDDRVRLRVFDLGSPARKPEILTPYPDDEGGRGLAIVAALASEWHVHGDAAGRVVWADIKVTPSPIRHRTSAR
jgi:serine/threonine-protein kinase RsbW